MRGSLALATGVLALLAMPASAAATVGCAFNPDTDEVLVGMDAGGDVATLIRSGNAIQVRSGFPPGDTAVGCLNFNTLTPGTPLVTDMDTIDVTDNSPGGDTTLRVDLSGGQFEPGESSEGGGATSEMELSFDGNAGTGDHVFAFGTTSEDNITLGVDNGLSETGADLNRAQETVVDTDTDLTVEEVEAFYVRPLQGNDAVDASGPDHFETPLPIILSVSADLGEDSITGGNGADNLVGEAGGDALMGRNGEDVLLGGADNDSLFGGYGDDELAGGFGNDHLSGQVDDDNLNGGDGADTLVGELGNDSLVGGGDRDATYFNFAEGVTVDLRLTGPQDTGEGVDTLAQIEDLQGGSFDDVLIGNAAENEIRAAGGRDTIPGQEGNDVLDGERGFDTVSYAEPALAVTTGVDLDLAAEEATGGEGDDDVLNFEKVIGSPFADDIFGNSLHNVLLGGRGKDDLTGKGGADSLKGQKSRDRLFAKDGERDTLINCGQGNNETGKRDLDVDPTPKSC